MILTIVNRICQMPDLKSTGPQMQRIAVTYRCIFKFINRRYKMAEC